MDVGTVLKPRTSCFGVVRSGLRLGCLRGWLRPRTRKRKAGTIIYLSLQKILNAGNRNRGRFKLIVPQEKYLEEQEPFQDQLSLQWFS